LARAAVALAAIGTASASRLFHQAVHIFVPFGRGGSISARNAADGFRVNGVKGLLSKPPRAGGGSPRKRRDVSPDGYTLIVVASGHATNPSFTGASL